jgi:hypothetical protein
LRSRAISAVWSAGLGPMRRAGTACSRGGVGAGAPLAAGARPSAQPSQERARRSGRPSSAGHLRDRAAAADRSHRLPFERLRKAPAPPHDLRHRHLQALQPIRGVRSNGPTPAPPIGTRPRRKAGTVAALVTGAASRAR